MTRRTAFAIRRHEDWPQRLERAVAETAEAPFAWGRRDCCLAAVALVKAMTGKDLARGQRTYRSEAAARRKIAAAGGLVALARDIATRHGMTEIAPPFAQRGDVAVVPSPRGEALGVVDLSGRMVLVPAPVGWTRVPLKQAVTAWRVET